MTTETFDAGLRVRKEVLGDAYVEASLARATEFTRDFQQLVTEFCWGAVWARPGLPRTTRSLLNVVMLVALNRSQELELHLRGALRNGCTVEEIKEAILQAAVYAGIPAGIEGFRVASRVIAEAQAAVGAAGPDPGRTTSAAG